MSNSIETKPEREIGREEQPLPPLQIDLNELGNALQNPINSNTLNNARRRALAANHVNTYYVVGWLQAIGNAWLAKTKMENGSTGMKSVAVAAIKNLQNRYLMQLKSRL